MKRMLAASLGLALATTGALAQNMVESPSDHPSPNCYQNNCVCPKNYSIRGHGTSSATGGVGANCEYDGLRSGGKPDDNTSVVPGEPWNGRADPINPALDGNVQSGAISR